MKKIFFAALAFLTLGITFVWACFNSDPSSILNNNSIPITGGNGACLIQIHIPGWTMLDEILDAIDADAVFAASFPFTLNLTFSGFVNDDGSHDTEIKRLILFYYSLNGEWTVLQDIKNPSFSVVSDSAMALWGRHCIPNSLGYSTGKPILIVPYFATDKNESFDLAAFLADKKSLASAKNAGAPRIALVVQDNQIAY